VNELERRYAKLLKVYPKHYREARGDEIVGTLLDASPTDRERPALSDVADLIMHGTQIRLGLTSDRFAGRVLGRAATPGLLMAAAMAVAFFVFGEWLPVVSHDPIALRFGPFWTIGPVVYLAWVLGAAATLLWPRRERLLAMVCVTVTLTAIPVGDSFFARPYLWVLLLLVGLGLPAVLAPSSMGTRRTRMLAVGAGLITLATIALWEVGTRPLGTRYFLSLYEQGRRLSHDMPFVAGIVIAVMCALLVAGQMDPAGAVAVLLFPALILSAMFPFGRTGRNAIDAICVAALSIWLVILWALDLRKATTQHAGST